MTARVLPEKEKGQRVVAKIRVDMRMLVVVVVVAVVAARIYAWELR